MTGLRGNTETITVSFPIDPAAQAEQLAKTESRTMSELLREAFRTYRVEAFRKRLADGKAYAESRGPQLYSAQDVERMVDEVRSELEAKRHAGR